MPASACVAAIEDYGGMPTPPGAPANLERTQESDARSY
jgi:hypothetical protein